MVQIMITKERIISDLNSLPENYKATDLDRLISKYVKEKQDLSFLREDVISEQEFHRIYFYVSLKQIGDANERLLWIDKNLLFSDWWHTDENINFVKDADFDLAFEYAKKYVLSDDPFIRRWGYVMFISKKKCENKDRLPLILSLMHNDEHYYVQMAEAWLIAELAIFFPDEVFCWLNNCGLKYDICGKTIQKICDSFRISGEYKAKFKTLRAKLKTL